MNQCWTFIDGEGRTGPRHGQIFRYGLIVVVFLNFLDIFLFASLFTQTFGPCLF